MVVENTPVQKKSQSNTAYTCLTVNRTSLWEGKVYFYAVCIGTIVRERAHGFSFLNDLGYDLYHISWKGLMELIKKEYNYGPE